MFMLYQYGQRKRAELPETHESPWRPIQPETQALGPSQRASDVQLYVFLNHVLRNSVKRKGSNSSSGETIVCRFVCWNSLGFGGNKSHRAWFRRNESGVRSRLTRTITGININLRLYLKRRHHGGFGQFVIFYVKISSAMSMCLYNACYVPLLLLNSIPSWLQNVI